MTSPRSHFISPLMQKFRRDLWRIKGQAVAIIMVISLGVMMLVMMDGLVNSLEQTKQTYYQRYHLADVFAPVKRAPEHMLDRIAEIPGVAVAEGRVSGVALIDMPQISTPIHAQAISLPDSGHPKINDAYLSQGRLIDPTRKNEILLLEGFAIAHGLSPGDELSATMNGSRRTFLIVGLAQSPEFLYAAAPGEMVPDDARFAVIWMNSKALKAAYDLNGAFNEALLTLTRDARLPAILDQVDLLLDPFGGVGSYGLKDQFSNRFITEEISGLKISSKVIPPIFLAVAAFLLYIVISRMVQAEREQVGLMKAFGYSSFEVGLHYSKFILVIAISGAIFGSLFGILAGRSLGAFYQIYYKFPFLIFKLDPAVFLTGSFVSIAAASAGGLLVLQRIFILTPAVAMRPPTPPDYSGSAHLGKWMKLVLDQPSRMVTRRLLRQPLRAFASVIGIGAGMALSVAMMNVMNSFDRTLDLSFNVIDRSDATVSFINPLSDKTLYELQSIQGVLKTEPFRTVSVILRNGLHSYRGSINGLDASADLNRAVDDKMKTIDLEKEGIILSAVLAETLHINAGDTVIAEVREGHRPVLNLPVVGIAETLLGSPAYMDINVLSRALKRPNQISGAFLRIDPAFAEQIHQKLKKMPAVAGVSLRDEARDSFEEVLDTGAGAIRYIMAAISAIITFGIVFNSARIAFAERARDLASLRILGFTRGETAFVLLGELAIITFIALPVGSGLGYFLSFAMSEGFSTDLYQIPPVFVAQSYGYAALPVLVASLYSGWLVKRDIDRIDLVSALKVGE